MAEPVEIRAHAGEPLDSAVWRAIGRDSGAVEATMAASPGLALIAHALPEGCLITIPIEAETPVIAPLVQLWE